MIKLSTSALTHLIAIFCSATIATTALASDVPQRAADRLLSEQSGLTRDEIRQLVQEVERDEPTSELAQTLRGLDEITLTRCNEHFYRQLIEKREQHLRHLPLARYFTDVMRRQRKWCQNYLETELSQRVGQFSAAAREYFELFVSRDLIRLASYRNPDNSISKLRELTEEAAIETREAFEAHFGERFFGACREINALLDQLEPIRRDHEIFASLPPASEHRFRVNSFCKNLVNFDLLDAINEILFRDVKSRNTLIKFGRYLTPEDQISFQVASDAALEYAVDYEFILRKRPETEKLKPLSRQQKETVRQVLSELRTACDITLEKLENIIWLLDFASVQPEELSASGADESHRSRLQKYLRTVNACQQMPTLNIENLLHRHQQHLVGAKLRQLGLFKRTMSILMRPQAYLMN